MTDQDATGEYGLARMSGREVSTVLWHVILFVVLMVLSFRQLYLNDIWWHLSIGREIFETWSIPDEEFLTFPSQGQRAPSYGWGFGLIFYVAYRFFGDWGMSALQALIVATTIYALIRASNQPGRISLASLIVGAAVLVWLDFRIIYRPELVLFATLALEIFLLERYLRDYRARWLLGIPVLGLVLTQAHPSTIFLMFVLGAYGGQCVWNLFRQRARMAPVVVALSVTMIGLLGAACINPYGIEQVVKPFHSLGMAQSHYGKIVEFVPALESSHSLSFAALALAGSMAIAWHRHNWLAYMLLAIAFGYLAVRYNRNIALLAIVMSVPMSRALGALFDRITRYRPRQTGTALLVAGVMSIGYAAVTILTQPGWGAGVVATRFPTGIVNYLKANDISGRIFNLLDIGGYLGWMLTDGKEPRIFIDGRQYEQNAGWETYNHILSASYAWDYYLQQQDVNIIITPATFVSGAIIPLVAALAEYQGWELVLEDQRALLFLREGSEQASKITDRLPKDRIWRKVVAEARYTIASAGSAHEAHRSLGVGHYRLREYPQAERALRAHLQQYPEDGSARSLIQRLEAHR